MWRLPPIKILVGICLAWVGVGIAAEPDNYFRSQSSPHFPQARPDRALVYFAKIGPTVSPRNDDVFVDADPVAVLPKNSYASVSVEPGMHHVWYVTHYWFTFHAGKTYLLRAERGTADWFLDDPSRIKEIVDEFELTYVTITETGRAHLKQRVMRFYEAQRQKSWHAYQEGLAKLGLTSATELPQQLGKTVYRDKLDRFRSPWLRQRGELTVDRESIRWRTEKSTLDIPIVDVRHVSFGATATPSDSAWVHVRYRAGDGLENAFFSSKVRVKYRYSYNRKFIAIREALDQARHPRLR